MKRLYDTALAKTLKLEVTHALTQTSLIICSAASSDTRSENTFKDAEAILSEALEIQKHLQSQDEELTAALKDALSKVPAQ